jgi:hypothetical protein
MASASGVRTEFCALRHLGPVISPVHQEQLEAIQQHIPNSSQQVQSDEALEIAFGAIRLRHQVLSSTTNTGESK